MSTRKPASQPGPSKLDRAKVQMAIGVPNEDAVRIFFSLLCQFPPVLTTDVPIAAIDARNRIYINPEAIEKLTLPEIRGVLVHEVLHGVYRHHPRMQQRDPKLWNIATDAIINHRVTAMGYRLPDGVIRDRRAETHTEEALYAELAAEPPTGGGPSCPAPGSGDGAGEPMLGGDLTLAPPDAANADDAANAPADAAQAAAAMEQAFIRACQQEQRLTGTLPGAIADLYAELTRPTPVPWQDVLSDHLTAMAQRQPSWSRPLKSLRRFAYLPSQQPQPSLGHVTVLLDVSGSIPASELADARGHVLQLLEQVSPTRLDLLTADTRLVQLDREVDPNDALPPTPVTHGGTDLEAALAELDADDVPDVCIVITDGMTPYTTNPWPDMAIYWLMSTDTVAPYGRTIPLPTPTT
jgi:predicted metal-dependent peptidase